MTSQQMILFALFAAIFGLLIWGKFRYDLVAFSALLVAVITGVVPADHAFSGFGHNAVIIIALVLVISRGLTNAGVIEMVASRAVSATRPVVAHIAIMAGVSATLSAIMNNVAALALLMPVDLQAAAKAGRSPAATLMPLSFASILGGLVTLIGTPPNIIVAAYREQALGTPFSMFDFTPVGGVCAIVGVLFIVFVGWRLIPAERTKANASAELRRLKDYVTELEAVENSKAIGKRVSDLDEDAEELDITLLGLIRNGRRLPGLARREIMQAGDLLVIEGGPEEIEGFAGKVGLGLVERDSEEDRLKGRDLEMREVVVPRDSFAEGRSADTLPLLRRYGISLLGLSRQGMRFRQRLSRLRIEPGDVMLLLGPSDRLDEATRGLGSLPLAARGLQVIKRDQALPAIGIFAAAVTLASFGLINLTIALGCVVMIYVLTGIVPLRELYTSIEWSIIVLLGALLPIGEALEASGSTGLIASGLVAISQGFPAWVALTVLMIITMSLSDVMNNTATAVIAAPIAIETANRLGVSPDPFLMAVAVAASCAFLTPIGHKNNTLIMGPGGYRFGDYWRMGLPLEILIVAVAVPMILIVWPF